MAHRSKVPKFGNWESGENEVPYTVYFDKARKERTGGGKMINPNDPEDNPDLFSSESGVEVGVGGGSAPSQIPPPSPPRTRPVVDDQFKGSPARGHDNFGNRPAANVGGGRRVSAGSEYSIEKSPLHQQAGTGRAASSDQYSVDRSPLHHQAARRGNNVNGSPSYESVKNSRDNNHGTPGRSRLGGGVSRESDEMDKGSTLPKFGEWDENNPASADGYTHIFNKVREEKHGAHTNPPAGSPYRGAATAKKAQNDGSTCCCFPWSRK